MIYRESQKKLQQIAANNAKELVVGESIVVPYNVFNKQYPRKEKEDTTISCKILAIDGDKITVTDSEITVTDSDPYKTYATINKEDIIRKESYKIGANPFAPENRVRNINYDLANVISSLNILGEKKTSSDKFVQDGIQVEELNWNPFVYGKNNEPLYYQRPFVWTTEQNQILIESIYLGIECGRILIRLRSFKEIAVMTKRGLTEIAFRDIVDGKQRLNALRGFIQGEYSDLHGNYYGDLSRQAQQKFTTHQLFAYCELDENTPDEKVLEQFLRLNFAGVPQSPEHIEYVRGLRSLL